MSKLYRQLPSVDKLAGRVESGHAQTSTWAARQVLDEVRSGIRAGEVTKLPDLDRLVSERCRLLTDGRLVRVINASGVVIHTNLGRAPWSERATQAALRAAGATDLEWDRSTGKRGGRLSGLKAILRALTGAEDALVVNNNAAAVLLALTCFAKGKEVVISRGELVEIGGSFRVPDVIESGGARLVEVGTTNRTRISDFADAINEHTGCLLKVHPSNFAMQGFVEQTPREQLASLAEERGLVFVEDLGSGALTPGLGEPMVSEIVGLGVDVVTFSGDKLLGGPQAGLVVGKAAFVQAMRKHPLYRALRVGKVTLAALEATLAQHLAGGQDIPVLSMLQATDASLQQGATSICQALADKGLRPEVRPGSSVTGGGARPGEELMGPVVVLEHPAPHKVAARLRQGQTAVAVRVFHGAVVLDPRTVAVAEYNLLVEQVAQAFQAV